MSMPVPSHTSSMPACLKAISQNSCTECVSPVATTKSFFFFGGQQILNSRHSCTKSPVSLTNLQVSVGGQDVLQSTLQYGYEHFLEQVNLAEQLTSSDFGISTGLINQNYWKNSKWHDVNVERGNAADN